MIPKLLTEVVKLGWGMVETKKAAKSAGIAGAGGVVYALLQPLFAEYIPPLADPLVGAPIVIWLVNTIRQFLTNHAPKL